MKAGPLVLVLHGPSGVGKDTVIDILRRRTGIYRAVSSTTRKPRQGEVEGVDYHFLGEREFERKVKAGEFLEHAVVYGDRKGLEKAELESALAAGKDVIIRTDVQGARTLRRKLKGAVFVLLAPEDIAAARKRLVGRATEDDASLERRLAEFDAEMADRDNNHHVVVNREGAVEEVADEVEAILVRARRSGASRQRSK